MDIDPATELQYLALQVTATKDQYRSAVRARNRYMRALDDGSRTQAEIAQWARMSEPQALRILSTEVDNVAG